MTFDRATRTWRFRDGMVVTDREMRDLQLRGYRYVSYRGWVHRPWQPFMTSDQTAAARVWINIPRRRRLTRPPVSV